MNELILVFLFGAGQVQFTSFDQESIAVQTITDSEEMKPKFISEIVRLTSKPNVKVCAIVPTYSFTSPLHKPLDDLLTEKIGTLPGILVHYKSIKRANAMPTIKDSETYCKWAFRQ